jgi:hypothetical protein
MHQVEMLRMQGLMRGCSAAKGCREEDVWAEGKISRIGEITGENIESHRSRAIDVSLGSVRSSLTGSPLLALNP